MPREDYTLEDHINDTLTGSGGYDYGQGLPKEVGSAGTPSTSAASFGNPAYDRIAGFFRQADPSYNPTFQDVSQWGTNIDENYFRKIQGAVSAAAQARQQTQPAAPSAPQAEDWTKGPWDADRVRRYYQSRGVTPNSTSPDYWAQKWTEFGQNDPAYFLQRLSTADEFGGGGVNTSFSNFSDPAAQLLERLAYGRVDRLANPPARPQLDSYINTLLERQKANDTRAQDLAGTFRTRAEELKQPAFSTGDEAVIRAKAFDQLERRRQATLKNAREGVYARGFAPTSGLVNEEENAVNDRFEQARTQQESDLTQAMIAESQRRRDQAVSLENLAQQALAGGDATTLEYLSQIADLEDRLINDTDQRELARIGAAGIPISLADNRTAQALGILGAGSGGGDPISSILQLLQFGQNQRGLDIANKSANYSGLGSLAGILLGAASSYGGKS